jgi:pimeloyl-ACP methyl ester carboxylesterase
MNYSCLFIAAFIFLFIVLDKKKRREVKEAFENKEDTKGKLENVNGINIYYIEEGAGEPLLIIHGFMASSIEFTEISSVLSKDFKVISVDLIGFGKSDKRPQLDYSKTNMADLISLLMKKKGLMNYNVLGHSMGGEVAMNLALKHEEDVKSLILVSSVGWIHVSRIPLPPFILERFFLMYYLQKFFYRFCFYNKTFFDTYKFERIYHRNSIISGKTLYSFSRKNDRNKRVCLVGLIKCPTLILWGSHDKIVPISNAYKFKKNIANSTLRIFENSGHLPYMEEQEKFLYEVKQFINNLS